jgi:hypothetical protein
MALVICPPHVRRFLETKVLFSFDIESEQGFLGAPVRTGYFHELRNGPFASVYSVILNKKV